MTESTALTIDRTIYAMPMFMNILVRDFAKAEATYAAAGFIVLATIPGPTGAPVLVHLRREKYQDILLTQGEPAPGTASVSFAAGNVDLERVASDLKAAGAEVMGPIDTPWFTTDVTFTDASGSTVTLTAPRLMDQDQASTWASNQITGDFEVPEGFDFATRSPDVGKI